MNVAIDHCEVFDGKRENIWMKCEHCGRYLFAADYLRSMMEERSDSGRFRVLDAACAEGYGAMIMEREGLAVMGFDINESYLEHARRRSGGLFYRVDFDCDSFPAEAANLDAAVCFETIEHINEAGAFLAKLQNALKCNGILLLSFPNEAYEKLDDNGMNKDPFHKRIFSPEEMRILLEENGFAIEEEYGQAICNWIVTAESDALRRDGIPPQQLDQLFRYDEASVLLMSRVIGYPRKEHVKESYSYIWICKKKDWPEITGE